MMTLTSNLMTNLKIKVKTDLPVFIFHHEHIAQFNETTIILMAYYKHYLFIRLM